MNVKKCSNGHFYDADKYQVCPHCGAVPADAAPAASAAGPVREKPAAVAAPAPSLNPDEVKCVNCGKIIKATAKFCKYCGTRVAAPVQAAPVVAAPVVEAAPVVPEPVVEAVTEPVVEIEPEVPVVEEARVIEAAPSIEEAPVIEETVEEPEIIEEAPAEEPEETLQQAVRNAVSGREGKTVGFFSMGKDEAEAEVEPVVGWLVCTQGKHLGESFCIYAGRNSVGRGVSNKIVLSKDNSVSREKHVWITYDPKHREFYIQPGEGSGLAYLNSETIMSTKKMAAKDTLEIGNGTYFLVPLCGEDFSWEEYIK